VDGGRGQHNVSLGLARRGTIASSHVSQQASSSALPNIVVGAYWPEWETVRLRELPVGYNTVLIAFAINNGTNGAIKWDGLYGGLNQTEFEADIQEVRARGVCVILSIGGAGITFPLDSDAKVTNFVSSVQSLYTAWGGFDGIDWDVENQTFDRVRFAAASRQLKSIYGPNFAICMAPAPSDNQYKLLAQDLQSTGDLDMISPQYYDYPATDQAERRAGVTNRTNELVNTYGINPHHIGVGTKHIGTASDVWTIASIVTMWNEQTATYPTLRGAFTWESIADRDNGGQFATTVAATVNPGGGSGGGGGGGGGGSAKIATLTDTFATFDSAKWTVAGAAAIQNSRIEIPRTWNFTEHANSVASTWDLTESAIYCQFTHPTTGHSSTGPVWSNFEVRVGGTTTNRFFFFIETTGAGVSTIIGQSQEVGVNSGAIVNRWTATYSTINHAWLRIREASGTVYWETSSNGTSWTQQTSLVRTANPTACQVYFSAAFNGSVGGTQGTTLVDNVNS
jgi:hypothetical protein